MRSIFLSVVFLVTATASGSLYDRGNGMIYDDVLNITWLQDASFGAGSAFDDGSNITDGQMTWNNAVAWADSLLYAGYDDWRLPSMDRNMDGIFVDCNFASEQDCQDNELGYMFFHNLMGSYGDNLTGDQGFFMNIQHAHWASEATVVPGLGWCLGFLSGGAQSEFYCSADPGAYPSGAWAVRDGDVAPVPLPAAVWLFVSAMAALGFARRRRTGRPSLCS